MLNNSPNYLNDEDGGGSPVPSVQPVLVPTSPHHHHQWPRLMKPPPFLISMAAVINYVCPTPNTNIVIFGEEGGGLLDLFHCGGPRSEMNGLSSWSFAGIGRRVQQRGGHGQGQLRRAGSTGKHQSGSQRPRAGLWVQLSGNLIRLWWNQSCTDMFSSEPNSETYTTFSTSYRPWTLLFPIKFNACSTHSILIQGIKFDFFFFFLPKTFLTTTKRRVMLRLWNLFQAVFTRGKKNVKDPWQL